MKLFLNRQNINVFIRGIIIVIFLIMLGNSFNKQDNKYAINIEYEQNGPLLTMKGIFVNNSFYEMKVFYKLAIKKSSKSGSSSSNQSGYAAIPVDSKTILSKSSVDFHKGALYTIHLIVKRNKIILADKEMKLKGSKILEH